MAGDGLSGEVIDTYRTLPARILGWGMVAGAAVLAALTLWDLLNGHRTGLIGAVALFVGLAAAAWVLFLRPHVQLREDGVLLANIVSDTVVPFAAVEEITHQWAFELHDRQGRRHSSWAIPVKRERVRRREIEDFAETTRQRGSAGATAQGVADEAQRALHRWRLDGGEVGRAEGEGHAQVRQQLSWPAVGVLGAAVALAVLAILL